MIEEKRKTRRRQMRHSAKLLIAPKQLLDCKLSNVSDTGARIEVADAGSVPDRFLLLLAMFGGRRACQVVRRGTNHVGVRFVRSSATPARKPAAPSEPVAESAAAPDHAE